jgi:predicted helicase
MVARVDAILRSDLGLTDGLADPNVYILDPCCGTGSYLVQVLLHIEKTLRVKRNDALLAHDLKQAAMTRVFGFEIMPAPFVIAHWQMGVLLHAFGAPLSDNADERAAIYLTNALTGWEPPSGPKEQIPMVS